MTNVHDRPIAGLARAPEEALAEARQLLADTAGAVNPRHFRSDLLMCVTRYRAHLAALVAVSSGPTTGAARD